MFRINKSRTVKWPVSITVARSDGSGKVDKFRFYITVRLLARQAAERIAEKLTPESAREVERELFDRIEDWHDVADDEGSELPYSRDNLESLLDAYPNAATALLNAIIGASIGVEAKN